MTKTPAQRARAARAYHRRKGLESSRAINRELAARDKAAADLRRRGRQAPGEERANAMARAFRETQP